MGTDMTSIRGAIALVAGQRASLVALCGLRFGERLAARAASEGLSVGVTVRLDRGNDGASVIMVTPVEA